jgi:short-subunit dehydrogenase
VAGVRHATDRLPGVAFMTADEVVAQAIKAAESGRRTLVPGILNALTVESVRLMPRRMVTAVTGGIFQPRSA